MQTNGDLSILSVGGSSVLADLKDVALRITPEHNMTKSLPNFGKRRQLSKLVAEFTVGLFSTIGGNTRVDFFNVTALTLGGTDIRCDLYSFEVEGEFERKPDPAYCSRYKTNANKAKDYKMTLEVGITDAGYAAMLVLASSVVESDRATSFVATINGVGITIQATFGEILAAYPDEDNQRVTFTVHGQAPEDGSAYPTAPTGTSTLLAWAFNGSKTTKAISFKSNATAAIGITLTGNVTISRFKFGARDGEVVVTEYTLETYGAFTVAATT